MDFHWIDGFSVKVTVQNGAVVVLANREGLLSLANHLTALAADDAPGAHFHLDEHNSLEDNSVELIVVRDN